MDFNSLYNYKYKNVLFVFYSLLFITTILIICGVDFKHLYFPSDNTIYFRSQIDAFLSNHFFLSSSISSIQFDLAWYNGGVQQIWGLGVPLWICPFEMVFRFFGRICPDVFPFFVILVLFSFYTFQTSFLIFPNKNIFLNFLLFLGLFFFNPSLWIFFIGPKGIYEVTCLYALIFCLILLVATIRYIIARRNFDFFLACFLAGFIANVRPTYGVYGIAAVCICLWHSLEPWRSGRKIRELRKTFIGSALALGGFLFLAWSNWLRFGSPFEFGHNLSYSGEPIVYLTRFGNPCDEASLWTLARELFFWLFTIPYWTSLEAPIPRWRDIYQPTFGLTYLALLILSGVLLVRFVAICKRAGRFRLYSANNLYLHPTRLAPSRRYALVNSLVFWFAISFVPLSLFYLRFATLSTRYIYDFAPAFLTIIICLLFLSRGKLNILVNVIIFIFISWKLLFLLMAPNTTEKWAPWPKGVDNFSSVQKEIILYYKGIYTLPSIKGKGLIAYNGFYSLTSHPTASKITGNGVNWNDENGTVGSITTLMVDHPQFLELTMGPEAEGFPEVYRAKINNIELPLTGITPTTYGTNTAKCVRFSIPESILRQNGDQLISLCFTPSFHDRDMKRTRSLYQVRWK